MHSTLCPRSGVLNEVFVDTAVLPVSLILPIWLSLRGNGRRGAKTTTDSWITHTCTYLVTVVNDLLEYNKMTLTRKTDRLKKQPTAEGVAIVGGGQL